MQLNIHSPMNKVVTNQLELNLADICLGTTLQMFVATVFQNCQNLACEIFSAHLLNIYLTRFSSDFNNLRQNLI